MSEWTLLREPTFLDATLGSIYINGHWACWTLEDSIREVIGQPVETWKIDGRTAIPAGRYRLVIAPSKRFGRDTPRLLNVPGSQGILIHPGNRAVDTRGCILPGNTRGPNWVGESRPAYETIFKRIQSAQDEVWLTIKNPMV